MSKNDDLLPRAAPLAAAPSETSGVVAERTGLTEAQAQAALEVASEATETYRSLLRNPIMVALLGLFVPAPEYPCPRLTVQSLWPRAVPALAFASTVAVVTVALLLWVPLLTVLAALLVLPGLWLFKQYSLLQQRVKALQFHRETAAANVSDWRTQAGEYFSTDSKVSQKRRHREAEDLLCGIQPQNALQFNDYVSNARSLAVYGCGILAAAHVGGLRALEKHGLKYENLENLAGVSAGSIVVSMVAVGCDANEIYEILLAMPLALVGFPELGAVTRSVGSMIKAAVSACTGFKCDWGLLGTGNGPGLNSGTVLETLIAETLQAKCGTPNITLGQVHRRFGKRLILIVTELDSGRELRLTPESDPDLPLRVAVRMSMGIPGLMEPYKYKDHLYCDGGMTDDFPLEALPPGNRIGLMIRPMDWMVYNTENAITEMIGESELANAPQLKRELADGERNLRRSGIYSCGDPVSLMMASLNLMMDANLMLQIRLAMAAEPATDDKPRPKGLSTLAPQVLTLCAGNLDPFDFGLKKDQHVDLYHAGQLSVHMHAAQMEADHVAHLAAAAKAAAEAARAEAAAKKAAGSSNMARRLSGSIPSFSSLTASSSGPATPVAAAVRKAAAPDATPTANGHEDGAPNGVPNGFATPSKGDQPVAECATPSPGLKQASLDVLPSPDAPPPAVLPVMDDAARLKLLLFLWFLRQPRQLRLRDLQKAGETLFATESQPPACSQPLPLTDLTQAELLVGDELETKQDAELTALEAKDDAH